VDLCGVDFNAHALLTSTERGSGWTLNYVTSVGVANSWRQWEPTDV